MDRNILYVKGKSRQGNRDAIMLIYKNDAQQHPTGNNLSIIPHQLSDPSNGKSDLNCNTLRICLLLSGGNTENRTHLTGVPFPSAPAPSHRNPRSKHIGDCNHLSKPLWKPNSLELLSFNVLLVWCFYYLIVQLVVFPRVLGSRHWFESSLFLPYQ